MSKKRESELERLDTWDVDKAEVKQPVKPSRVVFSVAFHRDDFERVSKHASLLGKKTSQFIREAAIRETLPKSDPTLLFSHGLSASFLTNIDQAQPITMLQALTVEKPDEAIVITQ
jgi:hypothetical protein